MSRTFSPMKNRSVDSLKDSNFGLRTSVAGLAPQSTTVGFSSPEHTRDVHAIVCAASRMVASRRGKGIMSDVSQGPGWWQASDGKWYAPQAGAQSSPLPPPPTSPMGAKEAKVAAKASKTHAKALRPWYKKKRFIFSGVIILLIIIIASSSS